MTEDPQNLARQKVTSSELKKDKYDFNKFLKNTVGSLIGILPEGVDEIEQTNSFRNEGAKIDYLGSNKHIENKYFIQSTELLNLKIQEYGFNCRLQHCLSQILKRLGSVMLLSPNKERCFPLLCAYPSDRLCSKNKRIIGKNGSYYIPASEAVTDSIKPLLPTYFDKNLEHKLIPDIFPSILKNKLVKGFIDKPIWQKIYNTCLKNYGYRCSFCGISHEFEELICNESWYFYDDGSKYGVAFFGGFNTLCGTCYEVRNFMNTSESINLIKLVAWLIISNKFSIEMSREYIEEAFDTKEHRDSINWEFDYTLLHKDYGNWLV